MSILIFFIGGEVIYRGYLYIHKPVYIPSSLKELVWELNPGAEGEMHGVRYKINSIGIRDFEYSLKKTAGVFRIAVVGDSVAFGYGIDDMKDLFSNVMEGELNKRYKNIRFEVLNFGISDTSSHHHLTVIKNKILMFEPDLVLLGYNLNDTRFAFVFTYPILLKVLSYSKFTTFVATRSYSLFRRIKSILGLLTDEDYFKMVTSRYYDKKRISKLKEILEEMKKTLYDSNIGFAVIIFPFSNQFEKDIDLTPQRVVSELCLSQHINFHDTFKGLQKYDVDTLYLKDDNNHFSATGNEIIGRDIVDYMYDNSLLPKEK